uniref:SMI1/KNR4 family protein n=1 Tax=Roseihalotalea indica TaxID=2867963 RepID=A0AA49GQ75_9BACT|nr:SMI1/KNR4 family protein [Tunicatimonas sp. TK19036]
MTAIEQLKAILDNQYESEDGERYKVELKPGLTESEIQNLKEILPNKSLPIEIEDLLRFTRGFDFFGFEEVTFDGIGFFGFEEFFPDSCQLASDGLGNFWIVDIDKTGNWGNVFYVCHDPPVVVKHSQHLSELISHIDEFGRIGSRSNLDIIHKKTVMEIWSNSEGVIKKEIALTSDKELQDFAESLPYNFQIADLRNAPNGKGFAYGKVKIESVIRHDTELLWAFEKKKGFFSRLFSK